MIVAIDETPVGVFVEIEGGEQGIEATAAALGRSPADYILDSYRSLFLQHRDAFGLTSSDMVFENDAALLSTAAGDSLNRPAGSRPLRALILTAGLGTRLRPLTSVRAKAAVPVNGEPLVRRVISWLVVRRHRDLVLNLHHRPASIAAARRRRRATSARACATRGRHPVLGSAGGPRHALPLLDRTAARRADGSFLIVNGDTLTDCR